MNINKLIRLESDFLLHYPLGFNSEEMIEIRKKSREEKNWLLSDQIRDSLNEAGIQIKDGKDGSTWESK